MPLAATLLGLLACAHAQEKQSPANPADEGGKPKIQLSFVNSCRPAPPAVQEMERMLARVNERPQFAADFEISRGVSTLTEAQARAAGLSESSVRQPSPWVRIRHEFPEKRLLSDAQYTLSTVGGAASENLALRLRNTDEALEILISTSAVGTAAQMAGSETPPDRIQVERYAKASLVLARCANYDQSEYKPIFQTAGEILRKYRAAMEVQRVVPAEMARLPRSGRSRATGKHGRAFGKRRRH